MPADLPPALRALAEFQRGVLSRAQVTSAGLSPDAILARISRGSWQRLYPGVYATFSGEPDREARLWAAVLCAGPGAVLSHQTAAELWSLTDEASSLIHLTVPSSRRVRARGGMVVHYSAHAAAHPAQTPPRTRVEDTVLDLWQASRNLDTAVGWVTRGIGRRRVTADKLAAAASGRRRLRWRLKLTELLDMDGVHSVLEYRYVRDVERRHGLPSATRQLRTRMGGRSLYRDEVYEAYRAVVELDGRVAHPGDARWDDIRRDNAAAAAGLVTLRYGWQHVTTMPCQVAAEIAAVLAMRGYTGARSCSADCPVGHGSSRPGPARARATRLLDAIGMDLRQQKAVSGPG
jgi:very-short-patch-repair endonuclease